MRTVHVYMSIVGHFHEIMEVAFRISPRNSSGSAHEFQPLTVLSRKPSRRSSRKASAWTPREAPPPIAGSATSASTTACRPAPRTRAMSSTIITRCATIQTCRTIPQASATHTANATASAAPASLGSIWATSSPPGGDELHTKGLASWTTTTASANDWP